MNLFDVIGPVMIGPSSSHTAGAVRLGLMAKAILGEKVIVANIGLHGSFARTYKGHGTDRALLAGLMGWRTDDARIPEAMEHAKQGGLRYQFHTVNLGEMAHPNTVRFELIGENGNQCVVQGASTGGGQVLITSIDNFPVELSGKLPGILVLHHDRAGVIANVSRILANVQVNVAGMRVFRTDKGGLATMIIECDQNVAPVIIEDISHVENVLSVRFIIQVA